jgi:TonB family protein
MRRALLVSLGLHAVGLVLVAVAVRPRFAVPPRLQGIPVDFIALAAPAPALTERARPTPAASPALTERTRTGPAKPVDSVPDPLQPRPRREPPRRSPPDQEPQREESKRKPEPKPQPDLLRQGSADTTRAMRSELPRVGDLRGAMQMRVEGDPLPYAYYLSIVQSKIASFWEPPAGIEQQPGEVAVIVWFRIEKDGAVRSSYLEEPSGISPFDSSALRALARALPLPPLPEDYPGDHLIIHLRFVYSREASAPAEVR